MRKILQITFCILACVAVAAVAIVGALFGFVYSLIPLCCAAIFIALMLFMKNGDAPKEKPHADFMNTDEENRKLNDENEQ